MKHSMAKTSTMIFAAALLLGLSANRSAAYKNYVDPDGGCDQCHGAFTGSTSTKTPPTVFPSGDKHRMHRNSANMGTDCRLCHTVTGDNPFIGSSAGIVTNNVVYLAGQGCSGCHEGNGLRAHHAANGVTECAGCHNPGPIPNEDVLPSYYGTPYTKANNPCNSVLQTNINENWSIGDYVGLDNDGDDLFDQADFDCGPPYRLLSALREGNNVRITWETVGGRIDAVQASPLVNAGYVNVGDFITNTGVGLRVTNYVEINGATNGTRFYRIRSKS